jgi:hypothetical protein
MFVNAETVLVCITGLIGFVAWLERCKARRRTAIVEIM